MYKKYAQKRSQGQWPTSIIVIGGTVVITRIKSHGKELQLTQWWTTHMAYLRDKVDAIISPAYYFKVCY